MDTPYVAHIIRQFFSLALLCLVGTSACSSGPCGDAAIECWTASTSTCPPTYSRYTGTGSCPQGYYCVDTRKPVEDMAPLCRDFSAIPADLAPAAIDMSTED